MCVHMHVEARGQPLVSFLRGSSTLTFQTDLSQFLFLMLPVTKTTQARRGLFQLTGQGSGGSGNLKQLATLCPSLEGEATHEGGLPSLINNHGNSPQGCPETHLPGDA